MGDWAEKPFEGIQRSTDYLLKGFPDLDPKRVDATGAGYGGYLVTWILGHTDRFACMVNHGGVSSVHAILGPIFPTTSSGIALARRGRTEAAGKATIRFSMRASSERRCWYSMQMGCSFVEPVVRRAERDLLIFHPLRSSEEIPQ